MPEDRRDDLVLAPGQQALILDGTKGHVSVLVGPHKSTVSQTDHPVVWDDERGEFKQCSQESAIRPVVIADEGEYVTLHNPSTLTDNAHPPKGTVSTGIELNMGRRINIPGPISFALWPRQHAKIIPGHVLRSNQYLLVRVYNDEEARTNWDKAVVKAQGDQENSLEAKLVQIDKPTRLSMGQLIIIEGAQVSYYIPSTGLEVVPDESGQFVRDAVTLESLKYCVLLGENGKRRFVRGPAVVFPSPTETFVKTQDGGRIFSAIQLNPLQGIYVQVVEDYVDEETRTAYRAGKELWITGDENAIYFPRAEHSIIRYGNNEVVHFAFAIPEGDALYILDRENGKVRLESGPEMCLPDPRKEIIIRRILTDQQVQDLFPNSKDALAVNRAMRDAAAAFGADFITQRQAEDIGMESLASRSALAPETGTRPELLVAAESHRKTKFTPPKSVTVDSRYQGAPPINVWPGYAVLVVSKTGERRVVVGPNIVLLEYDETLYALELSTGNPKTDQRLLRTAYLTVQHNKVSDTVEVETADYCRVRVKVSYRVNFVGESAEEREKWFVVSDYVKFLTEHLRSLLRGVAMCHNIEAFYHQATPIVRDAVLGKPEGDQGRKGRRFTENNMVVYDVEVLGVEIVDENVGHLLADAQEGVVRDNLTLSDKQRELIMTREIQDIERKILLEQDKTANERAAVKKLEVERQHQLVMASLGANQEAEKKKGEISKVQTAIADLVAAADLARKENADEVELARAEKEMNIRAEELTKQSAALSPELGAALHEFSNSLLTVKAAETMAPMALLGGRSVVEVLGNLLKGTPAAAALKKFLPTS